MQELRDILSFSFDIDCTPGGPAQRRGQDFLERHAPDQLGWPADFDPLPLILKASEWGLIRRGVQQRALAANRFLKDFYGAGEAVSTDILGPEAAMQLGGTATEMFGCQPPDGLHLHAFSARLVQTESGEFQFLDHDCSLDCRFARILLNREAQRRAMADISWQDHLLAPLDPSDVYRSLFPAYADSSIIFAPDDRTDVTASILADALRLGTAGRNYLAVHDARLLVQTPEGQVKISALLRPTVEDHLLDPLGHDSSPTHGVAGLATIARAGKVAIINPKGSALCDNRAVFAAMPELIRFYLGEEPVLNNVPLSMPAGPDTPASPWATENFPAAIRNAYRPDRSSKRSRLFRSPGSARQSMTKSGHYTIEPVPRRMKAHPYADERGIIQCRPLELTVFAFVNAEGAHILPGGIATAETQLGAIWRFDDRARPREKDVWVLGD
ncbi:MAG: circularly permuted type 2 ATP-grasp protein [Rhodobacteraceae bacterium]|nr:circularly permuted type 2 ATP-grasp protein [Paracoccaceae bacterium]